MNDNKLIAEFMELKDNKLIAEFMDLREHKGSYYLPLYNSWDWFPDVELEYHTSWDWLMPVLKKINLQVHPDTVGMWRKVTQPIGYDIHEVHEEAVEFIKRYGKSEKVNTLT